MSLILFEKESGIGTITFNNPDQLNAMTPEMGDELQSLVPCINEDPELRCVIFRGAGNAFSSGGNLDFIISKTKNDPQTNESDMIHFYSKYLCLKEIKIPTIAMINGHAVGAGLCIAMACDIRYANEKAKLGVNFARIGLSSGMGCLYHLVQLVGTAHAAELLFTGKLISGSDAEKISLVNRSLPSDQLVSEVRILAETIAANAPLAVRIMKKGIQYAPKASLMELFEYEAKGQAQCFMSQDLLEGIAAIKEKREPIFNGQ